MKYIILLFLLSGCFGQKKSEEPKQEKVSIQRLVGILTHVEFNKETLLGEGFIINGEFEFSTRNIETGEEEFCKGQIFRKEYQESFFYFHIDCYGNFTFNLIRK